MNNAALNMGMEIPLWDSVFNYFGYIPGHSIFNFLRNCYTPFIFSCMDYCINFLMPFCLQSLSSNYTNCCQNKWSKRKYRSQCHCLWAQGVYWVLRAKHRAWHKRVLNTAKWMNKCMDERVKDTTSSLPLMILMTYWINTNFSKAWHLRLPIIPI